ncbi:DEAD/DEAH box helicase [Hymenobacter cavernae]|uniref:DEAD/DEAH box helicase n=1 Tax=Hymenobacter cavernae TaxID=2044852 RepID=A0ABQ1UNN1_9BACT|nr:DEAD/DEAH box helicase [Hymenobacter cavernae]GGF22434.1 DEAD/DEAH box helicase [Hymenobacter cavernae]
MSSLPKLRDYQLRAIEGVRQAIRDGHRRILVVVPTGGGKTTIAGSMIHGSDEKGNPVLFMAHRKELVEQAADRLIQFDIAPGIIMAGYPPRRRKNVQVASIQTLIKRDMPNAKVVFVDEAHHSVSPSFIELLDKYPEAKIIGLTATPYRMDGRGLGDVYDVIVAPITVAELIEQGHLTPPRYYGTRKDLEPALDKVDVVRGDYDKKQLFASFDKRELYDGVVKNYQKFAPGTKAVVFNINVEHSLNVRDAFLAAGIQAEHVDGDTHKDTRKRLLQDFRAGKFEVLCNVNLLTEGFDLPAIETVILNRATKSKSLYLQMVGRGLRTAPGKKYCTVIDQGGNVRQFGPVEHPEEYELSTTNKRKASGVSDSPPQKMCPGCERLLYLSVAQCPQCAHRFASETMELQEAEFIELTDFLPKSVKVKAAKPQRPEHLKKSWADMTEDELYEFAELMNYKPGWVHIQLSKRNESIEA